MKVGLMGLPGAGVTTLFAIFTGRDYETLITGGKIEVNLGDTRVPDTRLDELDAIFKPKKKTHVALEFADVPVELDTSGVFSSFTINNLRNMDALAVIIRAFDNPAVPHPKGDINPLRDLKSISEEAILTDLVQIEKRLERITKEGRLKSREGELFSMMKDHLESGRPIRDLSLSEDIQKMFSGFKFLTEKPWLVILNTGATPAVALSETLNYLDDNNFPWLEMCGQMELEISGLDPEEQAEFYADLGVQLGARDRFIQGAYRYLNLISFFTVGEDECRAWSIERGTDALGAAGKIHTDLARGFIRAEVISYDDFMLAKSMAMAKKLGKMRLEGKNYVVQDGDIITIRFSV